MNVIILTWDINVSGVAWGSRMADARVQYVLLYLLRVLDVMISVAITLLCGKRFSMM